jgi:adenylate cyclase
MSWLKRVRWSAWLLAVSVSVAGWVLNEFAVGSGLVNTSYDLLHLLRNRHVPVKEAVVVYLDERSHLELSQPLNAPWDRAMHAALIDRLTAAGARAIVLDIVFSDLNPTQSEADKRLADAMRRSGRVVIAADHVPVTDTEKTYVMPVEMFRTNAAAIGSAEMEPSRDLVVRSFAPNEQLESLSWATAAFVGADSISTAYPEHFVRDARGRVATWVHYYGPPNYLPHVSYADALAGRFDQQFKDKTVFIGSRIITKFAGERKDEYRNPYSFWMTSRERTPFVSGVEIQATMFLNLLRGDWLRRFPLAAELGIILLVGVVSGYGLMRVRPLVALAAAAIGCVLIALASRQLFVHEWIWFPWLILVVQVGAALLGAVAVNSVRLYVENRLFVQSLELYLSPKLVKKFASGGDRRLLQLGAEKQKLTILFSDIEEFTALSERMDSDELARMMNEYFQSAVGDCIHATDGTIVKYIGDSIFAFWNAPEPQPDHAVRACEAALRFREKSEQAFRGRKLLTRIGLHTGVANVGNFGSETRVDYTAIGEAINLASRIEGLNKFLGTRVLITGETKKEAGDSFVTRYLGRFQLKGFERSVEVHELLGRKGEVIAPAIEEFDSALRLFQQRDLGAAENAFQRVLESQPDDGATKFYSRHIAGFRLEGVPPDWNGEVELKEK